MVQPHWRTGCFLVFPVYCMFWEIPAWTSIKASVTIQAEITKPRTLHPPTPGHLIVTNFLRATWRGPVQAGKTARPTDHEQRNHSPYLGQPKFPLHSHRSDPGTAGYPWNLHHPRATERLGFLASAGFYSCFFSAWHHINTNTNTQKLFVFLCFFSSPKTEQNQINKAHHRAKLSWAEEDGEEVAILTEMGRWGSELKLFNSLSFEPISWAWPWLWAYLPCRGVPCHGLNLPPLFPLLLFSSSLLSSTMSTQLLYFLNIAQFRECSSEPGQ